MMGSIIIWLTLALVSVGGEIMGEECFKLEPIYREISTEDLERGIVEVVEKHEIQLSRFRNLPQGLRSLREPDVVGQRVAELMARTSNKSAKPGFLRGYTVDQLCKINTWENNDEDCGETEFQRRTTICSAFKSSGVKTISQLDSGVNTYCSLALAEMRSSCAKWLSGKKFAEFEQLFRPYHRVAENLDSTEDHSVKSILARMDRKDADELISHCKRLCKNYKFIGLPGRYQDWDYYRQHCKAIKSVKLKRNCFTL